MVPPFPYTSEEVERVRTAATKIVMDTPKLVGVGVGGDPLLIMAALSMALAHAAILTRTSYSDVLTLLSLHHEAALIGEALSELERPDLAVVKRPEGPQ